jgi:hypothetical protein
MQITDAKDLPAADRYLWGYDLSLSGWGQFGYPATPDRIHGMDVTEYRNHALDIPQLCPVVYPIPAGFDTAVLRLNCFVQDVVALHTEKLGQPKQPIPDGFEEKLASDLSAFKGSIAGACIAIAAFDNFKATGMFHMIQWWTKTHKIPFVTVRTLDDCPRWFLEPGLGHVYHDDEDNRYCYATPAPLRKGDYALQNGVVRLQNYAYRGESWRPKVTPEPV